MGEDIDRLLGLTSEPYVSRHPATLEDEAILAQCEMGRKKSGGPGGQHRNKVETKVILTHTPTGVEAQAGERRSSRENMRVALFRLRLDLAVKERTTPPVGDARTALWRTRCGADGRVVVNPGHRDYPSLLAEALDVIAAAGWDERKAALRLSCTPSQLVKLVKEHPPALALWNSERATRGKHVLK